MSVYRPQERRLVLRLMAYWDDLRGDREFPRPDEVDPEAIGDDWPNCYLLKLADPVADSRFRHVGAALAAQADMGEGMSLGACPRNTLLYNALGYLSRTLEKGVPMSMGGKCEVGGGALLYRSIILPLSNDGQRIDHVLGGANGRPVTGDEE